MKAINYVCLRKARGFVKDDYQEDYLPLTNYAHFAHHWLHCGNYTQVRQYASAMPLDKVIVLKA